MILCKLKYIFYFGSETIEGEIELGIILKDLRKTFIVPDYDVFFDPLSFASLVRNWKTCSAFGFCKASTLFERNNTSGSSMSKSSVSRPTPGDRICRKLMELPVAYRDNCYFTHIHTDKVSCPPKAELNEPDCE